MNGSIFHYSEQNWYQDVYIYTPLNKSSIDPSGIKRDSRFLSIADNYTIVHGRKRLRIRRERRQGEALKLDDVLLDRL